MNPRLISATALAESLALTVDAHAEPNGRVMLMFEKALLHLPPTGYCKVETWESSHTFEYSEDAVRFIWLYTVLDVTQPG